MVVSETGIVAAAVGPHIRYPAVTVIGRAPCTPAAAVALSRWSTPTPAVDPVGQGVPDRAPGLMVHLDDVSTVGLCSHMVGGMPRATLSAPCTTRALTPLPSVVASAARGIGDRLAGLANGRFIAAGVSVRFTDCAQLPHAHGVDAAADGMTRLSIHASQASRVDVHGDWNGWSPAAATLADDGVWFVDVPLTPGEHRYVFRINGLEWRVPDGALTVKDGFGWMAACVTVSNRMRQRNSGADE